MTIPSATRRRQQALARWAKKTPGYRWALTEVLPRVSRSPVLSDLAWRIFAPRHGAGRVDVPLHGGRHVSGRDVNRLPIIGVVAPGLTGEEASALVAEVATLQQRLRSFRPLLVLDQPVFGAAREHGYVLEVLTPQDSFAGTQEEWTTYVATRLGGVIDHYQLWHLARAEHGRLAPLDVALLETLADRLPPDLALS